jgi:hypothetical protein
MVDAVAIISPSRSIPLAISDAIMKFAQSLR